MPDVLSNVINAVLHEDVPQEIEGSVKATLGSYTQEGQDNDIKEVIEKDIIEARIKELTIAKQVFKDNLEKKKKNEE